VPAVSVDSDTPTQRSTEGSKLEDTTVRNTFMSFCPLLSSYNCLPLARTKKLRTAPHPIRDIMPMLLVSDLLRPMIKSESKPGLCDERLEIRRLSHDTATALNEQTTEHKQRHFANRDTNTES
jgi:hypothetical protein